MIVSRSFNRKENLNPNLIKALNFHSSRYLAAAAICQLAWSLSVAGRTGRLRHAGEAVAAEFGCPLCWAKFAGDTVKRCPLLQITQKKNCIGLDILKCR